MKRCLLPIVLATALLPMSAVGTAPALPASVNACRAEKDDARRLACFDRSVAQLAEEASADQARAALAPSPEERFGLPREVTRKEVERRTGIAPELDTLTARITALAPHGIDERALKLDNNQVWIVKSDSLAARLEVGERITIRRGALGSYLLSDAAGRSMHAKRAR
jgi:hypothetical protein